MKQIRCPICDTPITAGAANRPYLPFCSDRCKRIDLGRWLGESYRIDGSDPSESPGDDDANTGQLPPTGP